MAGTGRLYKALSVEVRNKETGNVEQIGALLRHNQSEGKLFDLVHKEGNIVTKCFHIHSPYMLKGASR